MLSPITSSIFVSDLNTAGDLHQLKMAGITHVINLSGAPNRFPSSFQYLEIKVPDLPNAPISGVFPITNNFISTALKQGGKVLVHCHAGISRSPTIVIAYLMKEYGQSWQSMLRYLQQKRSIVNPNWGFINQLSHQEKD